MELTEIAEIQGYIVKRPIPVITRTVKKTRHQKKVEPEELSDKVDECLAVVLLPKGDYGAYVSARGKDSFDATSKLVGALKDAYLKLKGSKDENDKVSLEYLKKFMVYSHGLTSKTGCHNGDCKNEVKYGLRWVLKKEEGEEDLVTELTSCGNPMHLAETIKKGNYEGTLDIIRDVVTGRDEKAKVYKELRHIL